MKTSDKSTPVHLLKCGALYSYACRTGVAAEDLQRGFKTEADAKPENSLAQKLADHLGIKVHAFLRRSFYGHILRKPEQSDSISAALRQARKTQEGQTIQLSPEHEALFHPGLSRWKLGPRREGTTDYALWRKQGGLGLPTSGETPEGLPAGMRVFRRRPPSQ